LGDKKTILLANHGLISAGETIEEATYLAVFVERAAALQLTASAAGAVHPVDPDKAREARDFLLKPKIVKMTFEYLSRKALRGNDAQGADRESCGRDHLAAAVINSR